MAALAKFDGGSRSTEAEREPESTPRALPVFAGAGDILADLGLRAPPVDVKRIAEYYGYRVEMSRSPNGYAGAISFPQRLILVDAGAERRLQRYIIAHELGHAVLHRHVKEAFADRFDSVADPLEAQADAWANDLLITKNWLLARIEHLSIPSLAQLFDVPVNAIRARIRSIRL